VSGSIQKVDLLVGLNGREFSAFRLSAPPAGTSSDQKAGADSSMLTKLAAAARPYYGAWTKPAMALQLGRVLLHRTAGIDQAANDLFGTAPVGAMASLASASGQRVFVYRFDRAVPGKGEAELGAFHSLEVPYVFGALQDQEWKWLPSNRDDEALSKLMQTYWTNFAKTGNPNASGLPTWPVWSDEHKEFLVVERDGRVSAQRNFHPLFSGLSAAELKERLGSE
jgi:carboxylesterase type B